MAPAAFIGCSSGARTALLVAVRHPSAVSALVLAPPTGGGATSPVAIPQLSRSYYGCHLEAAEAGGMAEVIRRDGHYKRLAATSAAHRDALLRTPVPRFAEAMRASMAFIASFPDAQVLGVQDAVLRRIRAPTLVLHHGDTSDMLHSLACSEAAVAAMPRAEPLLVSPTYPRMPLPPADEAWEGMARFVARHSAPTTRARL